MFSHNPSLEITLLGGQSFCWDKISDTKYICFSTNNAYKYEFGDDGWEFSSLNSHPEQKNNLFENYFRADINLNEIKKKISKDKHIKASIELYPELRVLKQPTSKTIIQFIISQNCNIKSIRNRVRQISKRFGQKVTFGGAELHLFPSMEALAEAKLQDLMACSLGYRAKYVKEAAIELSRNSKLVGELESLDTKSARQLLESFKGIGPKVADCILLYGLGKDEVFPMDLWGQRIVKNLYNLPQNAKYDYMRDWIADYFEGYAGWAGQFLFEWYRE